MFGIHDIGLFIAAVFMLNLTPGPDTAYIVARSVAQGRLAGIVSALGIATGCCVHAAAAALGITALIAASPGAFVVIRVAGAVYLAWLGARLIAATLPSAKASARGETRNARGAIERTRSARKLFVDGLATNLLNPKVIIFFLSFFPQFIVPSSPDRTRALLLLGAIFVAMSTVYTCTIAWVAGTITRRLRGNPSMAHWLQRGTGAAFVLLGCKLALLKTD